MGTTTERVIDRETGEVVAQTTTETIPASDEPDYVKLYVKAWLEFKDIKSVNPSFIVHILPYMTYAKQGQMLILNSVVKRIISDELGWKKESALKRFNLEIQKLSRQGIIKHVGTDTWIVNPELVGRGPWRDVKALRATFHVIGPRAGHVDVEAKSQEGALSGALLSIGD